MNNLEKQLQEKVHRIGKKEFQNMKAFGDAHPQLKRYASFNKVVHLTCTELRFSKFLTH